MLVIDIGTRKPLQLLPSAEELIKRRPFMYPEIKEEKMKFVDALRASILKHDKGEKK
jgi:hypothetical protein